MCVIDVFTKDAWVKSSMNKKAKAVLDGFIGIADEHKGKLNNLWVDQGRVFYKNLIQKWLDDNDISMYFKYNEGKSVVAEKFIRTLNGKIYKNEDM